MHLHWFLQVTPPLQAYPCSSDSRSMRLGKAAMCWQVFGIPQCRHWCAGGSNTEQHLVKNLLSGFQIVSLKILTSSSSFNCAYNLMEKFPEGWIRFWKQCGACFDTRDWAFARKHQARLIISCACSAHPPHFVIHHRLPGCFLYILSNGSIFICNPSQNF